MNSMIDVREIKVGNYLQRKSNGNLFPVTPCIILDIENGKGGDYIPVPLMVKFCYLSGLKNIMKIFHSSDMDIGVTDSELLLISTGIV